MIAKPILEAVKKIVASFDQLDVEYAIGGSVASAFYGMDRTTVDVDIAVDLRAEHIAPLVEQLKDQYYIDAQMLHDAIRLHSSCNLIYLRTFIKIDLFVTSGQLFDQIEFQRARRDSFEIDGDEIVLSIVSPEDIILRKLTWYKAGGMTSERQWLDIIGVLKIKAATLDREYMVGWAVELGIANLLEQAAEDAGLPPMDEIEF